jgi:hypothetical protein
MAIKFIQQNVRTLREAYQERKAEYDALRAAGRWSGAILLAGTLLELALKLVIFKLLGVERLPAIFQVHDLDLLFYCSGHYGRLKTDTILQQNFSFVYDNWSMALRYEGAIKAQQDSDAFDVALFDQTSGVITFLSQYF